MSGRIPLRASWRRWAQPRRLVPLLLFFAFGIGAFCLMPSNPCGLPLHYSIGTIDPRFGIDRTEAIARAKDAQEMWEKRAGRRLLVYDESSRFKIDFIFDERQQAILDSRALDQHRADLKAIDRRTQTAASEVATKYQALKAQYESLLADFELRGAQHTAAVEYWNRRGGAPPRVFDALRQDEADLRFEGEYLESLREQANRTADGVAAIVRTGKTAVDAYNQSLTILNRQHGGPDEQAACIKDSEKRPVAIQVYEVLDEAELTRSLAHEFGHAFNVEHENDPRSIMKEVFEGDQEELEVTDASIAALKAACNPSGSADR